MKLKKTSLNSKKLFNKADFFFRSLTSSNWLERTLIMFNQLKFVSNHLFALNEYS